ncbi:MAG: flagellar hook-length control protein FliK [Tepidisphaeraceae bacterium]
MTASAVELVRSTQQSKSLTAVPQSKPSRSFDDVLAARRSQPEPRAEAPKPVEKKSDPKPTDDAAPVDDTQDVTDEQSTDAAETEASEATKTKPTKKTESKGDKSKTDSADDADETTENDTTATAEAAKPVCPTDLPAAESDTDGEVVEATEEKPNTDAKKDGDGERNPDLAALAAQVQKPVQPPASTEPAADSSDVAAEDVATVSTVSTKAVDTQANAPETKSADTKTAAVDVPSTAADGVPETKVKLKPRAEKSDDASVDTSAAAASQVFVPTEADKAKSTEKSASKDGLDVSSLQPVSTSDKPVTHTALPAVQSSAETPAPQRTVAEENVDRIVTSVRGEMQKGGGTMQIRLDPPSLGQVQVQISVDDTGVLSASLQTSNEEATRLLSHNLQQLKTTLETAGVMVDKIQVKQAAPTEQSSSNQQNGQGEDGRQSGQSFQDQSARQEQQRREMLQRMWAKLAGTGEPLDLVA